MRPAFRKQARWAAACALLAAGLVSQSPAIAASAPPGSPAAAMSAAGPARPPAPRITAHVPHFRHVAVLVDVDHDFASIFHNPDAPVINRLARHYGLATHYFSVGDPGIANDIAMLAGSTFGIDNDNPYWDEQVHHRSLLSQLDHAHLTWKAYLQGLPYPGYLGDCFPTRCDGTPDTDTFYHFKHNGVANFASVVDHPAQARKMVPAGQLTADAQQGRLPAFSLIVPSECDDMHGGPPWCEDGTSAFHEPNDNRLVRAGDAYVGRVVHQIMSGPQWKHGNNAIVITFDEGDTTAGCCDAKPGTGRIMTVVVTSHGPRGLVDSAPHNHYSLLSTIQRAFGLGCLQHTCDTRHVVPMARLFGGTLSAAPAPAAVLPRAAAPVRAVVPARPAPTPDRARPARPLAAAAPASPFARVASPNVGPNDNSLGAIAGRSASDIWAVGNFAPAAHPDVTSALALHYDGHAWSDVPIPDAGRQANNLFGVAALPDGSAWAVGGFVGSAGRTVAPLAEHWNGHRWAIVPVPDPSRREALLNGITAVSEHDVWAVGAYTGRRGRFRNLIEHWNGHRWSVRRGPQPGAAGDFLYSVTSAPGHGAWASGQELSGRAPDRQVILHLAGGRWRLMPGPAVRAPGGAAATANPYAIAASPEGLWLAGNARTGHRGFSTLIEHGPAGRGSARLASPSPTPQDNYLWGITPAGDGSTAWAVGNATVANGSDEALIEFGRATGGWRIVPSPDPGRASGGSTLLGAVLAFGTHDVWAVGTFDGANARRTLILHDTRAATPAG